MGNPVAAAKPTHVATPIVSVRFVEHARTGHKNQATRELKARGKSAEHPKGVTLDEDGQGRGIWIDERILVPWSNLLWVEYE